VKFLSLVWSNLKRKKLRTLLTVLSIFVAFALFGFLFAIREAFTAGVNIADADRLIVRHKVSLIQTMPVSYAQRIASVPGVEAVTHMTWFGGIYQDPKNFFASMPVDAPTFLDLYPEYTLDAEARARWAKTRTGCIIGRDLAKRFGWKVGDRIPLTSPIYGEPEGQSVWELEICGICDATKKGADLSSLYFRYDYFDEARTQNKGEVGWYTVRVKNADDAAAVSTRIDAEFANSPYETKSEPEGAFAAGFAQQIGDIGAIMISVLSAVFFTILLVAGNTMNQAVRERTEELGVLKAMGFSNGLVLALVLAESCLIALLGGLVGLALAWGTLAAGNPVPQMLPTFFVPVRALVLGAVFVVALGLIAGALPAFSAMRLRTAEALRRNG
jgi:putative ABC transport system permease protein